jgi:hypothetical protein
MDSHRTRGTAGLSEAVEALPLSLAGELAAATADGCSVVVSLRQEMTAGDPNDLGIHLSVETLRWLAAAGAALDVDQYVVEPAR